MKITNSIILIAAFLLLILPARAQEDSTQAYYKAYNTCSPAAHFLTRQACNYGVAFEKYYTTCMSKKGFGGEDDTNSTNYYEGYMKAYNICYSSAEKEAQESCNYGASYQTHYNRCMAKYNFNARGEKVSKGDTSEDNTQDNGFEFDF